MQVTGRDLARIINIKGVKNGPEPIGIHELFDIYCCWKELSVVDFLVVGVVYFFDYGVKFFGGYVFVGFLNGGAELVDLQKAAHVSVQLLKFCFEVFDLIGLQSLHKNTDSRLFQDRLPTVGQQLFHDLFVHQFLFLII